MSLISLTALNEILPSSKFFKSQKSFIVNLSRIEGTEGNLLIMDSKRKVPVSKTLKGELIAILNKGNLL